MKKALLLSFTTIALLLFFSTRFFLTVQQAQHYQAVKDNGSYNVTFSDNADVIDTHSWSQQLKTLSQTYQFNLYKIAARSNATTQVVYAQLTQNKQRILAELDLEAIGNSHYSNRNHLFSAMNQLVLLPLNQMTDDDLKSGNYRIQRSKTSPAIEIIVAHIQQETGVAITIAPPQTGGSPPIIGAQAAIFLSLVLTVLILMLLLICDYYINYRHNSIKLMLGFRRFSLLHDILRKQLPYTLLIPLVALSFALFDYFYHGIQPAFKVALFAISLGLLAFIISYIILSIALSLYPFNARSLKGDTPLKRMVQLLLGAKLFISLLLLLLLQLGYQQFYYAVTEQAKTDRIITAVAHHYYLPLRFALTQKADEKAILSQLVRHNQLFADYYKEGLLLFYPTSDTDEQLQENRYSPGHEPYTTNEVWVSPDYLALNDIRDTNGQALHFNNDDDTLITLIPSHYYSQRAHIKKAIEEEHRFQNIELGQAFGLKSKPEPLHYRYIEILDNQPLLTFLPYQRPLKNPVIKVLTVQNVDPNLSAYADSMSGNANSFFVGNPSTTHASLKKIIRKHGFQKTYPQIIPAQHYLKDKLSDYSSLLRLLGTLLGVLSLLYLLLTFAFTHHYLLLHVKKNQVLLQHGYSLTRLFAPLFLIACLPWLVLLCYNLFGTHKVIYSWLFFTLALLESGLLYCYLYRIKNSLLKGSRQ